MAETILFVTSQQPDGSERIELGKQRGAGIVRKASSEVIPRAEWIRAAPPA